MAEPTTCPHGVTVGQRCFACNSADTLPLTMPAPLARELAAAREKLATLERLEKLRAHEAFGVVLTLLNLERDNCSIRAIENDPRGHNRAARDALGLLVELLRGAP